MKIFSTGDRVLIVGDLIDDQRPETFIGMYGTVEFYDNVYDDVKNPLTQYYVKLEGLSDAQKNYFATLDEMYPFFYEKELDLVG